MDNIVCNPKELQSEEDQQQDHYVKEEPVNASLQESSHNQKRDTKVDGQNDNQSVDKFLKEIMSVTDQSLDEAQPTKHFLNSHRMKPALYAVLCELKTSKVSHGKQSSKKNYPEEEADKLLFNEGITGDEKYTTFAGMDENQLELKDYKDKMETIKQAYNAELEKYKGACKEFTRHVENLLNEQALIRPIKSQEIEAIIRKLEDQFSDIKTQLKQSTCEAIVVLRSRILDARKRRKNFDKESRDLLNEFFYSHIHKPYPDEDEKEKLAKKCKLSVKQVSNWLGNKRIRYRKSVVRKATESAKCNTKLNTACPVSVASSKKTLQTEALSTEVSTKTNFSNANLPSMSSFMLPSLTSTVQSSADASSLPPLPHSMIPTALPLMYMAGLPINDGMTTNINIQSQ